VEVILLLYLVILILIIAGTWATYEKAGKPGWASIVPIYNVIVLLEIAGKPIWWIILLFIPFVNIIVAIMIHIDLAKSFRKEAGFGLGLTFCRLFSGHFSALAMQNTAHNAVILAMKRGNLSLEASTVST
jgi:hypothetical protein